MKQPFRRRRGRTSLKLILVAGGFIGLGMLTPLFVPSKREPDAPHPEKTPKAVDQIADEIKSYMKAEEHLNAHVKQPYQAKNEAEFDQFEQEMHEFTLPSTYPAAWIESLTARQANIREQYASVRSAVAKEVEKVQTQITEGKKLDSEGNQLLPELAASDLAKQKQGRQHAEAWFAAYSRYIERSYATMPGDEPISGGVSFTYADLRKFRAVRTARQEWDKVKNKLDETSRYMSSLAPK